MIIYTSTRQVAFAELEEAAGDVSFGDVSTLQDVVYHRMLDRFAAL
jgi:hypothetical protein